ncbi:MAG: hypothetical protein NTY22_07930 [Proteobacteria bacterium]|nr:hypothetical protein [Pseudomonadota bacterium]
MISVPITKIMPDIEKLRKKLHVNSTREEGLLVKILAEVVNILDPKYSFKRTEFNKTPLSTMISASKELSSFLKGSLEGFVVICTVGHGAVKLIDEYQNNKDMISALYADRISSDAVENLAECIATDLLNKFFDHDLYKLTRRYSPGYGDLPIERQKDLFDLFDQSDLDIILTDRNYMKPDKSVSYIVGILPNS